MIATGLAYPILMAAPFNAKVTVYKRRIQAENSHTVFSLHLVQFFFQLQVFQMLGNHLVSTKPKKSDDIEKHI